MSLLSRIIVLLILAVIAILLTVIMGDYGPWYLAWLLGTGFMILVAAMGGVLYENQARSEEQKTQSTSK
ncbi:hypothetical protein [Orrella sp. 11846]|uniref:hypothetical protein n=1 Tax=Orrella sp. 11846 TaxID=3409913 RepID=UPI003B595D65